VVFSPWPNIHPEAKLPLDGAKIPSAREAKEFLVSKIVAESQREGVPLFCGAPSPAPVKLVHPETRSSHAANGAGASDHA